MNNIWNSLKAYFNKRNTFKVVVIELQILGLLLCAVLAMNVKIDMSLKGDAVITVEKGTAFEEPGVIAVADGKNLDVKTTGMVNTDVPGTYTLCYQARRLLTTKELTRTVHVVNTRAPILTLTGDSQMTIAMGAVFEDPGYRAVDRNDADITNLVQVSGGVDTMEPGTYTITYSVTDDAGRAATAQRTVIVEAVKQPDIVQPEGRVIYLTFDDGPSAYTEELLAILEKYNVKATFFVVGNNSNLAQRLKAIADGGHSIGIHTMTHNFAQIYASEEAFLQDLYGMQALIYEHTGIRTTLMRFPGGTSNTISANYCKGIMTQLVKTVTDLGFQYFDWNVDSDDAGRAKTAEQVYQNVVNGIGNMKVAYVLQHDSKAYSVDAVEKIIQWGLANGYTFLPLTTQSPAYHHGTNN